MESTATIEKIIMLTEIEELFHSNETWHALNSPVPDTNCIFISFK